MIAKQFTITIMKSRTDASHDAINPRKATKPGARGQTGEFYQFSVRAIENSNDFEQGRLILFNVWNNGARALLFNRIKNILVPEGKDKTWEYDVDKNITIFQEVLAPKGQLVTESVEPYYLWDASAKNGKGDYILDLRTGLPRVSSFLRIFIFRFEFDAEDGGDGSIDAIIENEKRVARAHPVLTPEDNTSNVRQTIESTTASAQTTK